MLWWMLIIPAVTVGLALYYKKTTAWWMPIVPFASTTIFILIMSFIGEFYATVQTEYHGGWLVRAVWNEHWTEKVERVVDDYTTDSKGNRVRSGSHVEISYHYHPDSYMAYDSNRNAINIDEDHFDGLVEHFKNRKEESVWRLNQSSWGDGRRFITTWQHEPELLMPAFTAHYYKNRVANSNSVFNFKKISKEEKVKYQLFDYPKIYDYYHQDSLLGWPVDRASHKLSVSNALLGASKQVRIFILVFRNQPLEAGFLQQQLWKNGNKNEVVVCVGLNSKKIEWVHTFAWENEKLLVNLKEEIVALETFDPNKVVDLTVALVNQQFKRKEFKDFDYVTVKTPTIIVVFCFLGVVIMNVGMFQVYFSEALDNENPFGYSVRGRRTNY